MKRKTDSDWYTLLCGTPAEKYTLDTVSYEDQIQKAVKMMQQADAILIGAGAGVSAAAGLTYSGKRFTDNFAEFITKYGREAMPDMYAAGFYPFPDEQAKWGYWSKHAMVNRVLPEALPLYRDLFDIIKQKPYFVLTTNVDHQFHKAGFDESRIFATQGDYGEIQCEKGCHDHVYDAVELFEKMDQTRHDCRIPEELVPKCPVCGGNMTMHLRCDQYFVEDEAWDDAMHRYVDFLNSFKGKNVVLLELGVGFNTPIIIRFPFEKILAENSNFNLIRLNRDEAFIPAGMESRAVGISGDMKTVISDLRERTI